MNNYKTLVLLTSLAGILIAPNLSFATDTNANVPDSHVNNTQRNSAKHAAAGKTLAPIAINYAISETIQTGTPVAITIKMTPHINARRIVLEYRMRGALQSTDAQTRYVFPDVAAGNTVVQVIHVTPQAEGNHRVLVGVTVESATGRAGTNAMTIPIRYGNAASGNARPAASQNKRDNQYIVTPAQEEIIKH